MDEVAEEFFVENVAESKGPHAALAEGLLINVLRCSDSYAQKWESCSVTIRSALDWQRPGRIGCSAESYIRWNIAIKFWFRGASLQNAAFFGGHRPPLQPDSG